MPGLNGSGFSNSYNSSLGEAESMILEAEIPLFELKPTTLQYYSDKIMGLWAVRVNERVNAANRRVITVDWYNKKSAYVVVDVFGKNGKRFAYVPDDPLWHNRILMLPLVLGSRPAYDILRYHTQDGFSGGARAIKELVMLRDLTQEYIVWNRDKEVEVFRSFDGEECDKFILDAKRKDKDKEVEVIGGAEVIIKKSSLYKESAHYELRVVKQPHIQKIIDRSGVKWFEDLEWRGEVLPDIQKKIADQFGEADRRERREQALQYVPELKQQLEDVKRQSEQLQPILKFMNDPAFAAIIQKYAPDVTIPTNPIVVDTPPMIGPAQEIKLPKAPIEIPETHTELSEGVDLKELNAVDLRRVARNNFGIKNVEKKSKEALLSEIREKQGIPDEEPSSEADEIDVNE